MNGAVYDFKAAPQFLTPNVEIVPLAGHTLGLAGVLFTSGGKRILLSGDTIMNPEFYVGREGYFIDESQEATRASMEWAAQNTDLIVPGHGDWFFSDISKSDFTDGVTFRKLNLAAEGEETAVLVCAGNERIVINPVLPGHLLREALYDARGLDPADVTRVICLQGDPKHVLDVLTMRNARFYLPEGVLPIRSVDGLSLPAVPFEHWDNGESLPVKVVQHNGTTVCLFKSSGRKIAVAAGALDEKATNALGADLLFHGGKASYQ